MDLGRTQVPPLQKCEQTGGGVCALAEGLHVHMCVCLDVCVCGRTCLCKCVCVCVVLHSVHEPMYVGERGRERGAEIIVHATGLLFTAQGFLAGAQTTSGAEEGQGATVIQLSLARLPTGILRRR